MSRIIIGFYTHPHDFNMAFIRMLVHGPSPDPATRKDRGVPLVFNEIEFSLLRRLPESNGLLKVCKVHAGKVMGNGLLGSMLGIFGIGRWNSCGKPLIDHMLRRFNVITVNLGNVKTRILPEKNPMARSY